MADDEIEARTKVPILSPCESITDDPEKAPDDNMVPNAAVNAMKQADALSGWRLAIIFCCLSVALLLSLMDESIVATALVDISVDFNNFRTSLWVVLAYTLTYLGFAVLSARLADCFGRKPITLVGLGIFTAFSFGTGFAQTLNQLIAFRALQGVGGSMMYSMSIISFAELAPLKLLPLATSIVGVVLAVAGALGPVLGGVITSYSNWRWIFWINPPISIPTLVILYLAWPKETRGSHLVSIKLSQVDFIGAGLLLAATVIFTFSLQEAGARVYAWNSGIIIALLTISGLSFVALVGLSWILGTRERFSHMASILPWRVLSNRVLLCAVLNTILTGYGALLVVVQLPIYFQIVNVLSPVQAGIHLLPSLGSTAVGAAVGGLVSRTRNYTYVTLLIGNAINIVGNGLLSVTPVSFDVPKVLYGYQVISGFGAGLIFCCTTMIISLNTDFRDHAVAQGLLAQVRVLGGTLGVATTAILFGNQITSLSNVLSQKDISILYRNPAFISQLSEVQQYYVRGAFAQAFNQGIRITMYIGIVGFVVTLLAYQRDPPSIEKRKQELEDAINKPSESFA